MKAVSAVLTCFALFFFAWALMAGALYVIGWAAAKAGHGNSIFAVVHVLVMWILCPTIAAGVAVYGTSEAFKSVPAATIFVSFVSAISSLTALVAVMWLAGRATGIDSVGEGVVGTLQIIGILIGARAGRSAAE